MTLKLKTIQELAPDGKWPVRKHYQYRITDRNGATVETTRTRGEARDFVREMKAAALETEKVAQS